MTALADIRRAIAQVQLERQTAPAPILGRHPPMGVVVGESAERSIACETCDGQLPAMIDGVPVSRTREFLGWEVRGAPRSSSAKTA